MQALLRSRSPAWTAPRIVSGPTLLTGICFCAACGKAMTLRTAKSGRYRYYTCSTKARQGETGCRNRTFPMEKLDTLVVDHIEHRLLPPARLDPMLRDRIAELKAIRDQAHADAERAEGAIDRLGPTITTQSIKAFARTARKRMRTEGGGYRRDYLRSLANASKSTPRNFASWARKANCCARSSPLQAQKRRVLACPVLYRSRERFEPLPPDS